MKKVTPPQTRGSLATRRAEQAADAAKRQREIESAQVAGEQLDASYKILFGSERGKAILMDLCARFAVAGRVFVLDGAANVCPVRAGIRDGERAAVTYILSKAGLALAFTAAQPTEPTE